MKAHLFLLVLAGIIAISVPTAVLAGSNSTQLTKIIHPAVIKKSSAHYKYCISLKDKKTRSSICPDIFPKSSSSVELYG